MVDYHIRPFPRQPKKGGKKLIQSLQELEEVMPTQKAERVILEKIRERIHQSTQDYTDDLLVDLLRQLSLHIEEYEQNPQEELKQAILEDLTKIRQQLKHL